MNFNLIARYQLLTIFVFILLSILGCQTTNEQKTSEQTTNEQTTSEQTTNEQTTNEQTTSEQTTNEQTTNEQTTNEQTTNEQTTPEKLVEKQTVIISGRSNGSGVIIATKNGKYYVITSKHVVGISPGEIDDPYKIRTHDNKEYEIDYKNVFTDPVLDLAIVEFDSKNNQYPVTKISNSNGIVNDQKVYVSGWRDCKTPKYELNQGVISKIVSKDSSSPEDKKYSEVDFKEGYKIKYTNKTITGMSGGGIFDESGNLVAIHGKTENYKGVDYNFEACGDLQDNFSNNWGISIQDFLNSKLKSNLPSNVELDTVK
jgi:S1-C subfamily serine protease